MFQTMGQSAPCVKGPMPWDKLPRPPHTYEVPTERAYLEAFIRRTRELRQRLGVSQAQMADWLRVDREKYRMYERRTPLPHFLIESFCGLARVDIHFFVTGKRAGAQLIEQEPGVPRAHAHARPPKPAAERRRVSG